MKISFLKAFGLNKKKKKTKRVGGFRKKIKSRFDSSQVGASANQISRIRVEPDFLEISSGGLDYNDKWGESYTNWIYKIGLDDSEDKLAYVDFSTYDGSGPIKSKKYDDQSFDADDSGNDENENDDDDDEIDGDDRFEDEEDDE